MRRLAWFTVAAVLVYFVVTHPTEAAATARALGSALAGAGDAAAEFLANLAGGSKAVG